MRGYLIPGIFSTTGISRPQMKPNQPIVITGFMGCGKSKVARELARFPWVQHPRRRSARRERLRERGLRLLGDASRAGAGHRRDEAGAHHVTRREPQAAASDGCGRHRRAHAHHALGRR